MRFDIKKPVAGRLAEPFRILAYGPEGVGKSSLAAGAPSPLFFDPTGGTEQLNVARVPRPSDGLGWTDIGEVVDQMVAGGHEFKTLVLDELGEIERLCWAHICQRDKEPDITGKTKGSKYAFNRGPDVALEEWRQLLLKLEKLRHAGINVFLLGHCTVEKFKNPEGDDFDRYSIAVNKKASGLLRQWCDAVLFCRYEVLVGPGSDDRPRGVATGSRKVHTRHDAAFDAKNRYGMPDTLPLDWAEVAAAMLDDTSALMAEIATIRERTPALASKLDTGIEKAGGDANKLAQLVNWARTKEQAA
jgi:hypothetical protein